MANYPKELIDLLNQYLTDGVMTSKEREVLLRKAEAMNVDKDEFDLFIDAEIQKIDQKMDAMKRQAKGRLCPFCEAQIPMLADKCPECGGNITPEATKELEEIIDKLEDALVNFKSGKDIEKSKAEVERYIRKAEMYYENNTKVKKLVETINLELTKAQEEAKKNARKKTIIGILKHPKLRFGYLIGGLLILLVIGINLAKNDYSKNPEACIEMVNEALKNDDVTKAESYCAAFFDKHVNKKKSFFDRHNYDDDLKKIELAYDAIIKFQQNQINELIKSGDLDEAKSYLSAVNIQPGVARLGSDKVVEKYDPLYLNLIREYVKLKDLESAEALALTWRTKINNESSWFYSGCYKLLKSEYAKVGKDFSVLKSEYNPNYYN